MACIFVNVAAVRIFIQALTQDLHRYLLCCAPIVCQCRCFECPCFNCHSLSHSWSMRKLPCSACKSCWLQTSSHPSLACHLPPLVRLLPSVLSS